MENRHWSRVGKNGGQRLEQGGEEWKINIEAGQGRMEDTYWSRVGNNGKQIKTGQGE